MKAADVREVFETILPEELLLDAVRASGLQTRTRKLDAVRLLRAMVIAASTGYGGRQADVMRLYLESGAKTVVRGAFYSWFGEPLAAVMGSIRERALDYVARQRCDLPGWLGREVSDWVIVDSCTVKLGDELKAEYPGAGDYAALKVHKHYSVGIGATIDYHFSAARDHDSPHLHIDESWSGKGLLADLGYASLDLLSECGRRDVKYVLRLKENWKPKVQSITRGTVTRTFAKGTDLDLLLADETLRLDGKAIDAVVQIGGRVTARLVAVHGSKGYCFYLTNLSPRTGPRQVADLYRVRWEIESDNKLDKSCMNLSEVNARSGAAVRALVHASLMGSMIISLLVHHHRRRETKPKKANNTRTSAPLHPQSLAKAVGCAADGIARAMELRGGAATKRWQELTDYMLHLGRDPNWRTRPSILDQLRGWRIAPKSNNPRAASLCA